MEKYKMTLKSLSNNNLEEIVKTLLNSMEVAYKRFSFPHNCCDFATQFGGIVLKDLGYEVEAVSVFRYTHSCLLVNDKIIDFTINQYKDIDPGIIGEENKTIYSDSVINNEYTSFIQNVTYEYLRKNEHNFMNYIILTAMDSLISNMENLN